MRFPSPGVIALDLGVLLLIIASLFVIVWGFWREGLWRGILVATPFLALSALDVAWQLFHTPPPGMTFPPTSERLAVTLILIWSFYPGAVAWAALFSWCLEKRRAGVWSGRFAIGVFWVTSLSTMLTPVVIHTPIIMENQARGHGPFAHIGEGAMYVMFLPVVSAALSTLITVVLASQVQDQQPPT